MPFQNENIRVKGEDLESHMSEEGHISLSYITNKLLVSGPNSINHTTERHLMMKNQFPPSLIFSCLCIVVVNWAYYFKNNQNKPGQCGSMVER